MSDDFWASQAKMSVEELPAMLDVACQYKEEPASRSVLDDLLRFIVALRTPERLTELLNLVVHNNVPLEWALAHLSESGGGPTSDPPQDDPTNLS